MKIVIVGGVAGGASAAARARRLSEDVSIVVFERGSDVSFANCGLPYHIGGKIPKAVTDSENPEDFKFYVGSMSYIAVHCETLLTLNGRLCNHWQKMDSRRLR
jgi:NADH dehydrogenase FAD-containing subunit